MADDHHGVLGKASQAADDALVVGKGSVSVQFVEVFKNRVNVVKRIGPVGVTSHLSRLPGGKIAIDFSRAAVL